MAAPEIPKTYKAAVYDNPGSISTKVEELETPEPGFGEVLINLYDQTPPAPFDFWFLLTK
jgi:alcohol dehydrogenase, propanol-preferring